MFFFFLSSLKYLYEEFMIDDFNLELSFELRIQ